jgi:hypothetical protein
MEVKAMFDKLKQTKKLKAKKAQSTEKVSGEDNLTRAPQKAEKKIAKTKKSNEKGVHSKAQELVDRPGRKKTDEGFKVYTEDELGLGEPGTGPNCPFDCDCCV